MLEKEKYQHSDPEALTDTQQEFSTRLFEIGAIKIGNFKLKLHDIHPEAPLSPLYIDLRILRRFPEAKKAAVNVYEELIQPLSFELLADIPTAATPFVSSLSDRLGIGVITPRSDTKSHGSGASVDGLLPTDIGRKAVLIDDLVTHADSKIEAAQTLRNAGMEVHDVVVLIDREIGGKEQLATHGLTLHSAFSIHSMLDFYAKSGRITQAEHENTQVGLDRLNTFLKTTL